MIEKPTVLILGAGASMPYGFPTGRELVNIILKHLNPLTGSKLPTTLKRFGIKANTIRDFSKNLAYSGRQSVDAFLEHRPEFLKVGKLAITLSLIPYENELRLFDRKKYETNWYEYLFNKLNAPFNSFHENKLAIITFNYDRSIEHYLITALSSAYGKSTEECAVQLNTIPIIHVHGRLGALPWQEGFKRLYEPEPFIDEVEDVSEQIKVITEDVKDSSEFKESFTEMRNASDIIFLGFGYHDDNLQRLRIKEFGKMRPVGSAYGLGNSERQDIEGKWGIKLPREHGEVLEFLKNQVTLR